MSTSFDDVSLAMDPAAAEEVDTPTLVIAIESRQDESGEWIRRASTPALPELCFEGATVTEVLDLIDDAIVERYGQADSSWHWLHFYRVPEEALRGPAWRATREHRR